VEGADPTVGGAVELTAGVVERVDTIRQANLLERPLRPEVFRLAAPRGKDVAEAIERDHVVSAGDGIRRPTLQRTRRDAA
jgi:hypothetical protein